jgi:hypothetical protein
MKTKTIFSLLAVASLALGSVSFAASAKDYQVTGPVIEVTPAMIAVQKGSERWEVQLPPNTKGVAEVKVGDKVTVHYTMSATDVEKKGEAKGAKKDAKAAASPKK